MHSWDGLLNVWHVYVRKQFSDDEEWKVRLSWTDWYIPQESMLDETFDISYARY